MSKKMFSKYRGTSLFIILAAIVTVISVTIYTSAQQVYRSSADDPQVEAAQAISDLIAKGTPPEAIVGQNATDISNSLSLFVVILDKDGKVVAGSGKLNNAVPVPPSGVIDYLKKHSEERFTWQPQKGVRLATVAHKVDGDKGFVIVARSLREIEIRIQHMLLLVGIAWVALLLLSALLAAALSKLGHNLTMVEETTNVMEVEMKEKE